MHPGMCASRPVPSTTVRRLLADGISEEMWYHLSLNILLYGLYELEAEGNTPCFRRRTKVTSAVTRFKIFASCGFVTTFALAQCRRTSFLIAAGNHFVPIAEIQEVRHRRP